MYLLPKKVFILLFFILFSSLSFVVSVPKSFAVNPQQVFYPSLESLNNDENASWDNAAVTGKLNVNLLEQKRAEWGSIIKVIDDTLGCTNPKRCNPQQTVLGTMAYATGAFYAYPVASGIAYTKDLLANAGIFVKPAYAQGIGFAGLSPLLPLWKTSRNISYIAITIVMISIGFMVIFRMKIDPKTVISVQAALPKIVLTLILITLSYPIVGFMVDLMYLVMAILISIVAGGSGQTQIIAQQQSYFMTAGLPQLFGTVFLGTFAALPTLVITNLPIATPVELVAIIAGFLASFSNPFTASLAAGALVLPGLLLLILFLGLLFTFIRIWLLLLNSYIQLLIALILGPIQLLAEAIPGKSAFTEWILNVMANLVVFPATVVILLFGKSLTSIPPTQPLFTPPFLGVPFVSGASGFPAFLGIGVLFLAPNLIAQIKKMFHPKPLLPVSAGTLFAPLTGATQTVMGGASQFYYMQSSLAALRGMLPGGGVNTK